MKRLRVLLMLLFVTSIPGCIASQANKSISPFEANELDGCLAIVIDMSGSFAESWDDRAFGLFTDLADQYFTDAMGTDNRLVISQLSGNERAVLFEGKPSELQQKFSSPQAFSDYLKQQSDPTSSNVYDSVRRTVDYIRLLNGVTENTRLMTVVLSDLKDSESDRTTRIASGTRMVETLRPYAERGGALALYFVSTDEIPRWRRVLDESGFQAGQYLIETELNAAPQLPQFD
jgi:hypothetical protein